MVMLKWNNHAHLVEENTYDGRWEVFVRLEANSHPNNKFHISKKDLRLNGHVYRFLQTWCERDGKGLDSGYAPIDSRFTSVLYQADTFRNRRWYEDEVEAPEELAELKSRMAMRDMATDTYRYYKNMDSTTFGRYTKGDWRHKIR